MTSKSHESSIMAFGRSALLTTLAPVVVSLRQIPIRAVVSDMDGTLYPFAGRALSEVNRMALTRCVDAGVHVCLATGRVPGPWYDDMRAAVPGLGPCVFANGALVLDGQSRVLHESTLPVPVVAKVLDYSRGGVAPSGGRLSLMALTRWFAEDASYGGLRYCELSPCGPTRASQLIDRAGEPSAVVLPHLDGFEARAVLKFVIWSEVGRPGWAATADTVAGLRAALDGTGVTIIDHSPGYMEVLPPGVNKGVGVGRLLEELGVAAGETLACGDAENDVEMLRLVGVGAAMGNAQPAALEAADFTVASNAEDGVAEAIRRFVWNEC